MVRFFHQSNFSYLFKNINSDSSRRKHFVDLVLYHILFLIDNLIKFHYGSQHRPSSLFVAYQHVLSQSLSGQLKSPAKMMGLPLFNCRTLWVDSSKFSSSIIIDICHIPMLNVERV